MKIEGPNKSSGAGDVKKTGKAGKSGGASFSGMVGEGAETASAAGTSGAFSVSNIDALLSVQESGDGTSEEATKKARQRAAMLLDQLDQVRMGILNGGVPVATLQSLTRTVGAHRDTVMDPHLREILDDIDLRAQVELAKLEMSRAD